VARKRIEFQFGERVNGLHGKQLLRRADEITNRYIAKGCEFSIVSRKEGGPDTSLVIELTGKEEAAWAAEIDELLGHVWCDHCGRQERLPAGGSDNVTCSHCGRPLYNDRTVVKCPRIVCGGAIRLPAGKKGKLHCPHCRELIEVSTM
jgi:hypothetical protein